MKLLYLAYIRRQIGDKDIYQEHDIDVLNIFRIGYEYSYLDSCGGGLIFVRLTFHWTSRIALVIRIFPVCGFHCGLYDHFADLIECLRSFVDFAHDEMPLASVYMWLEFDNRS